jgi:hypothetical protein
MLMRIFLSIPSDYAFRLNLEIGGKMAKQPLIPRTIEFSKNYKFNLMRRLALIIAGLPGLVLVPFAVAAFISLIGPVTNTAAGILTVIAVTSIFPSAIAMITLLVIALITLFKKTIDPESSRPKPHVLQIFLAVITAAMPATAMIMIWSQLFQECETSCNIFSDPIVTIALTGFFSMWIALGTVWIRSKQAKPISE